MSLLYTVQGLDRSRYQPVVAFVRPSSDIIGPYAAQGIKTIAWPGIRTLSHTALGWTALHRPLTWSLAVRTLIGWAKSERRTFELVDSVRPDLVHLNSAVLVPSARALYRKGIPFVWHIREGAAHGHLGLRYAWMGQAMLRWPSELIFLSEAERLDWVGGSRGRVIPNFVDFTRFDHAMDGKHVRHELGIEENAKVVLYVGGLSTVKGIFPLLQALALVKEQEPRVVCLMPGSVYQPSGRLISTIARAVLPAIGYGTRAQRVDQIIRRLGLEKMCIRIDFEPKIEKLLAACDVLVFPATTNHFARPIVEAAAMGKPVVASRFPILEELVKHQETGLLVPPNESAPLAEAILALLQDPEKTKQFGERSRLIARSRYNSVINTKGIMQVYDDLFTAHRASPIHVDLQDCSSELANRL